jgi:CheY-like chemotaxis protein
LSLIAADAGFDVLVHHSGEDAIDALRADHVAPPSAILADMQMPGLSGDPLAHALRPLCPPSTLLIAMSGTPVALEHRARFDSFLLKPFSIEALIHALSAAPAPAGPSHPQSDQPHPVSSASQALGDGPTSILSLSIYTSFKESLRPDQLRQLYTMSLDDADRRIGLMRQARAAGDADAFKRSAHSVKGGCGMVGALELARLAAHMEHFGPQPVDLSDPLDEFLDASARLRRILDAHQSDPVT